MTSEEVERRVREVIADCVQIAPGSVGSQVPFVDLGLDSVGALVLVERLEQASGLTIPEEDWLRLTTVEAVVRYVARRTARANEPR